MPQRELSHEYSLLRVDVILQVFTLQKFPVVVNVVYFGLLTVYAQSE